MSTNLQVNGRELTVDADADMPLLWILREQLGLTGVKYGCGIGECGACTIHVDGNPMRSCGLTAAAVAGKSIVTIEGLSNDGTHPVQEAWINLDVPQCGYCQSGMIMAAVALLQRNPTPSDSDIAQAMTNLCRCGTYVRIRAAILQAAATISADSPA